MRHDLGYRNGSRREADETMLRELNELDNGDLTCNELLAKYFTRCVVGIMYRARAIARCQ